MEDRNTTITGARFPRSVQIPILLVLVFVSYIPSLSGEFLLDDHPYVKENPFIRDMHGPVPYLSQEDGIGYDPAGDYHSGYYRPLVNLSYTLDYLLWGMNPGGFRFSNVVLHLVTCLVLYGFLRFFLGGGTGPFWAALLFGLHPVNTESVAWVVSRNNILVTLFGISALYFYIRYTRKEGRWAIYLSLLFFAASLLCKEFAVMLMPIIFLYHRVFREGDTAFREECLRYLAFGVVIIAYLALRKNATLSFITPGEMGHEHLWRGLLLSPWLILYNLRIILLPFGLHYFRVGYPEDALGLEAGVGFLGVAILAFLLWRWRRKRFLVFAFVSFGAALFPVLHVVPSAAISLVSMRWLYFPMAFLAIAGAWALERIPAPDKTPLLPVIVPGALALFLGAYTLVLNQTLWKNEKTFFTQEIFGFQNRFYLADLAKIYHLEGDLDTAYLLFQRALAYEKEHPKGKAGLYLGYAALLVDRGRSREALRYLDKAEEMKDSWEKQSRIDANRGVAHFKMRNFAAAIRFFHKALLKEPQNADLLGNLGNAYMAVGRYGEAISLYRKSLEIDPDRVSTIKMLGIAHLKAGEYRKAVESFERLSAEVIRNSPTIENMLLEAREKMPGALLQKGGNTGGAETSHVEP
jgi:protein O-mannosyl-transferase